MKSWASSPCVCAVCP